MEKRGLLTPQPWRVRIPRGIVPTEKFSLLHDLIHVAWQEHAGNQQIIHTETLASQGLHLYRASHELMGAAL